jgi:hypothetical protein
LNSKSSIRRTYIEFEPIKDSRPDLHLTVVPEAEAFINCSELRSAGNAIKPKESKALLAGERDGVHKQFVRNAAPLFVRKNGEFVEIC